MNGANMKRDDRDAQKRKAARAPFPVDENRDYGVCSTSPT
jgi:hypothetical protein